MITSFTSKFLNYLVQKIFKNRSELRYNGPKSYQMCARAKDICNVDRQIDKTLFRLGDNKILSVG